MWSTIPFKDSHLFKIVELKIFLKQKLITNSAILNMWEFFSRMMDKWRGSPENCIIYPPFSAGLVKINVSLVVSYF